MTANFIYMRIALVCMALVALLEPRSIHAERLVVKYRGPTGKAAAEKFAADRKLPILKRSAVPNVVIVEGTRDTVSRLSHDPAVVYVEREKSRQLTETIPTDPHFPNQWQLRNTGQFSGLPGADVKATQAWDVTTGSASIIIGIVDTGVDVFHEDLASRLWQNEDEIAGNGIDDDSNGFIDDRYGWNFADNNNAVQDVRGHGTTVAGCAGAAANNGVGISGIDWNARLMAVNGFGSSGSASDSTLADGVIYAINNGAKIINASWGGYEYSFLMEDMVRYAAEQGVLICAASGNENADTEANPFYPASINYDALMSIGGTDSGDFFRFNHGRNVDVSAPGWQVWVARLSNAYNAGSGTSYASPMVAGAASLLLGQNPSLSPANMKNRLIGSCDPIILMAERNMGNGRMNVFRAVTSTDLTPPSPVSDLQVERAGYNGAILKFTAPGGDGSSGRAARYHVRVTTGTMNAASFALLRGLDIHKAAAAAGREEHVLLNTLESGVTYQAAVRAVDAAGNAGPISNVVSFSTTDPPTLFYDSCDTTSPMWTVQGFELAEGGAHSGVLSWQDSPGGNYAIETSATLTSLPINIAAFSRPRLSFYLQQFFVPLADRLDGLDVQVSTDGGVSWNNVRRIFGAKSPTYRVVVPLDEFKSAADLRLRFLFTSGWDLYQYDGVYVDDIRLYDAADGVPEYDEQILESVDYHTELRTPPEYYQAPSSGWILTQTSKSVAPRLTGNALTAISAGTTGASARFVPFFPETGYYDVFATWGSYYAANNVPYKIGTADGLRTQVINQSLPQSNQWINLGRYRFNYGRDSVNGSVEIDVAAATSGMVTADGVMFRYVDLDADTAVSSPWAIYD